METRYIIVQSDSLVKAKKVIKDLMKNNGFPDKFYKFLVGENRTGRANGKDIKNNTVLTDFGNGNFLFKLDYNIVEEFGELIESLINDIENVFYCVRSCHCQEPCSCDIKKCTGHTCGCGEYPLCGCEAPVCDCDIVGCTCIHTPCTCANLVKNYMPEVIL